MPWPWCIDRQGFTDRERALFGSLAVVHAGAGVVGARQFGADLDQRTLAGRTTFLVRIARSTMERLRCYCDDPMYVTRAALWLLVQAGSVHAMRGRTPDWLNRECGAQ